MVLDIIEFGQAQRAVGKLLAMSTLNTTSSGTRKSSIVDLEPDRWKAAVKRSVDNGGDVGIGLLENVVLRCQGLCLRPHVGTGCSKCRCS